MSSVSPSNVNSLNISHAKGSSSLDEEVNKLSNKIRERGDLSYASIKEQLELLQELAEFPLGQFLILNKGLNGEWTDYILLHPNKGRQTGLNSEGQPFSKLEDFFLNRAPSALATQERYTIFQEELQKLCKDNTSFASIPCGLMSDLLTLNFEGKEGIKLFGIDLDKSSIESVQARTPNVECIAGDAWSTSLPQAVDIITSNGLNIYESDNNRVVELYRQFFNNLKPGGTLITSFLTPPPQLDPQSEWNMAEVNLKDAGMQKVLFVDILSAAWQSYRSSDQTINQLKEAGFEEIRIVKDRAGIFPTVVAKRPQ